MSENASVAQWTDEEIRSRIADLGEWFQNINLNGVSTPRTIFWAITLHASGRTSSTPFPVT